MTQDLSDYASLDTGTIITLTELAQCCGLSDADLEELVDYNALAPLADTATERTFSAHWVMPLRTAARMRLDFDLDVFTMAILLGQLIQIDLLQRQVQSLKAQLPEHLRPL